MQFNAASGRLKGAGILETARVNAAAKVGDPAAIKEVIIRFVKGRAVIRRGAGTTEEHGVRRVDKSVVGQELETGRDIRPDNITIKEIKAAGWGRCARTIGRNSQGLAINCDHVTD